MDESMQKKFIEITKIIRDNDQKLREINFTNNFYENRIEEAEKALETIKKNIKKKHKYLNEFLIPNYQLLHSTRKGLEAKQRVLLDALNNQDHLNYLINQNRERVEAENKKLELECKKEIQERKEKYIANNKSLFERYEQVKNKLKLAKIEEHIAIVELAKVKQKIALKKEIQQKQYYAFFVKLAEQGLMVRKMDELNKLKLVQFKLMQKLQECKTKRRESREIATFSLCSPPSVMAINDTENHDNGESTNFPEELNIIENKLLLEMPTTPILNPDFDIISMRKRKRIDNLKLQENPELSEEHPIIIGLSQPSSSVVEAKKVQEIENRPISASGQKRFKSMQLQQNEEQQNVEKKRESSKSRELFKKSIEIEAPCDVEIEQEKLKLVQFQQSNEEEETERNRESLFKKLEKSNNVATSALPFFQNTIQEPNNNEQNNVLEEIDDTSILNMSFNSMWDEADMSFLEDNEEIPEQNNIPKSFSVFNLSSASIQGRDTGAKPGFSFGSKDMNPFGFL